MQSAFISALIAARDLIKKIAIPKRGSSEINEACAGRQKAERFVPPKQQHAPKVGRGNDTIFYVRFYPKSI